jgi:phage terminase small subunit
MVKICPICGKPFEGNVKKKYCSPKCKKTYENSLRSAPKHTEEARGGEQVITEPIHRPQTLNEIAAAYWDKLSPVLIERGHLNVLSEDAFAELCDIHSRLVVINKAINDTNASLLQIDDKWDNKSGVETQSFKESALSDLKRKYSRQFLDYCKSFYLTPLSNRGNYGLKEIEQPEEKISNRFDD